MKKITFAAADAFRLAVRIAPLPGDRAPARRYSGSRADPDRTWRVSCLPKGPVEMIVTPNRSQVLFHTEQIDLVSRLIEGTFPNIRQIIPKRAYHDASRGRDQRVRRRVKLAALFARDSSNITRVKINPGENDGLEPGAVTIEATAEDLGDNISELNAAVDGPEQQIIFNVKYLSEVLAVIGSQRWRSKSMPPPNPASSDPSATEQRLHLRHHAHAYQSLGCKRIFSCCEYCHAAGMTYAQKFLLWT